MGKYVYILLMVIMFSNTFFGLPIPFGVKYLIGFGISIICLLPKILKTKKIEGIDYVCLKNYVMPIIFIGIWSMFIWGTNPPSKFSFSNITRLLSNCCNLILSITVAISTCKLFGKEAIKYSVIAIAISIGINCLYAINVYGFGLFINYLPQAMFSMDFIFNSSLYNLGLLLEVQDATLACGFYLIYFLFLDKIDPKTERIKYTVILLVCSYIGFKRTEFIAIVLVAIILILMKKFKANNTIVIVGILFTLFCIGYVVIIKLGIFSNIVKLLGVNITGRENIYSWLNKYFDLSIVYIGKGFTYVDKIMYELTGFATHNTIVRMYAEIGCIPFIIWLVWYLIHVPLKVFKRNGKNVALVTFSCILYLFFTYCIGNSMNFFCIQFSFMLVQVMPMFMNENNKLKEEKNENSNIIDAESL